jgi:glutathione S-transferase
VLKSHGQDYLVGNRLSRADIHLLEVLLYIEELDASLLATFPLLQVMYFTDLTQAAPFLHKCNI